MSEHLTRFFIAATRFRRSERPLVRSGAVMELEELRAEARNTKLQDRITEILNAHYIEKAKKSATT